MGALTVLLLSACQPTAQGNVLGYLLAERMGTLPGVSTGKVGAVEGVVLSEAGPIEGAGVVLAERTGRPHRAWTDDRGRYRIDDIPVGKYVPIAVAGGYDETVLMGEHGPRSFPW